MRERTIANAFINSGRYALILDGLDEIPAGLRQHFSERLDEFVRGLPGEVGVVVTCRTQEYEELLAAHSTGLGLVQAVEILPLSSEQLDSALTELAKFDEDWGAFLSQRDLTACQRARGVLSNPLFLNLAVAGRLRPRQLLLEGDQEQEVRDLVLDKYLARTLAAQRHYAPADARRYLSWIARFLNRDEVSPFGQKTTDFTVFDLADLTPPDPPRWYRLFGGPVLGLIVGLGLGLGLGLIVGLFLGLVLALGVGFSKRSAVSSRLTLVWPSTRRQLLDFVRRAGRGLAVGLVLGLIVALPLALGWGWALAGEPGYGLSSGLFMGLAVWLGLALPVALPLALVFGLLQTKSLLIASRTPKEARSRSLIAALTWLASGLASGLVVGLVLALLDLFYQEGLLVVGLGLGLVVGPFVWLVLALNNGGWFVLLQKVAHRRLARAGNLPPHLYDFLEWGIETQIFRRIGGGVRFRHNLIQQQLASTSD